MGDDSKTSVTDADCRFHGVKNTYVASPALFPTIGSPNPMLTGIALARRLGDHLLPPPNPPVAEAGFRYLFDGTQTAADFFANWLMDARRPLAHGRACRVNLCGQWSYPANLPVSSRPSVHILSSRSPSTSGSGLVRPSRRIRRRDARG